MMRLLLILLGSAGLVLGAGPPIDPDIIPALDSRGSVRVTVALRQPDPTRTLSPAELSALLLVGAEADQLRVISRFQFVPAVLAEIKTKRALDLLASSPVVDGIELDSGGYGIFVPRAALPKVARIAILDTGLPEIDAVSQTEKLAGEVCFCRLVSGRGCCPDGGPQQSGSGSAKEPLRFATSSLDWLRLSLTSESRLETADPIPNWDPFVTVFKVLSASDRFDSWEPVFAALDWLAEHESGQHQDFVLFSLASAKLYVTSPCDSFATGKIWKSILTQLASKHISPITARARGGPGEGSALPGCLDLGTQVPGSERLPLPQMPGQDGLGLGHNGAPRAPIERNGTAARGIVESVRAAANDEVPPVDTAADATWSVVRIRIVDAAPLREGLAQMLSSGKTIDVLTIDPVDLLKAGRSLKLSAVLMGDEGRAVWFGSDWRLIAP